jgi:hypothetical protein
MLTGCPEAPCIGPFTPGSMSASPVACTGDWDLLEATSRRPEAIICLTSALAHHDLTDAIPDSLDIAIPRGTRIPKTRSAIRWHVFAQATFTLVREELPIPGAAETIGIASPERCIADAFRLRGEVGYELGRDALREWLRRGGKPSNLMSLAIRLPRATKPLLDALQVMA